MVYGDRKAIKPHEAHELFWLMFDLDVVPMATWSFSGHFLNVNKPFLEMLGLSEEEFHEMSWVKITPREYAPLDQKCIEELRSQHVARAYEKEYVKKDGSRVRVRLHNATHDLGASEKGIAIIVPI